MNKLPIWLPGLAIALLPVVCSALVVVPISSSLQMTANTNAVSSDLAAASTIIDTDSDAQSGTVNPLSISVSAFSESAGGFILSTGDATATWNDPAQGQVIWNVAWLIENPPGDAGSRAFVSAIGPGDGWIYTFTADTNGFFSLDFAVSAGGSTTNGVSGFTFRWFLPGIEAPLVDFMAKGTSGTITQPITAGDTFTVTITTNSGLVSNASLVNANTNMTGTFGWRIFTDDIVVGIDIKPGSDPNCFNINGNGVIPVAILGSDTFDVLDIDTSALFFAGLEVRVRGKKGPLCHGEDSNGDGFLDLVCKFEDDPTMWTPDSSAEATLAGMLLDGTEFEGTDSICVTQEVP